MMQESFVIQKIAVLGAGVMGAQIAALCVNAGFETLLYDLTAKEGNHNAIVNKAIANLSQLKPSPLATPRTGLLIKARNYDDDLSELSSCSLVIEAIAERLDLKESLYRRISPHLTGHSILVSNTSGLSINALLSVLPEKLRLHFCGVHFFNPPRYMHLAELIPAKTSSIAMLDYLESWLTSQLGKGVVRAKDTPNFIANRVGVFSLLATLYHSERMGIALDEVDALTGVLLGRPKSATFRTMDVVGLDTLQHVVSTMHEQLKEDPWFAVYTLPDWLTGLIKEGSLGQKSGQGIYRKQKDGIEVYVPQEGIYRLAKGDVSDELKAIMKQPDPQQRFKALLESKHSQAQFLVAYFSDLFHYCAYHLEDIASNVREVDLAIRWGFGWVQGPFETWQSYGMTDVRQLILHKIEAKEAMSLVGLPSWVEPLKRFYGDEGAYSPANKEYEGRSRLPVYDRQMIKTSALGVLQAPFKSLYENEGISLWVVQDDIGVVSFKSKANTIGQSVLDGLNEALHRAEKECQGLIIYQHDADNFSSGADLKAVSALLDAKKIAAVASMIESFQQLVMRLKYSVIPTIAAVRGRALGGGCELMMHCSGVVAGFEAYPGLVEIGVGLIPAGGGCKEMAMRAAREAEGFDLQKRIRVYFEQIAMAVVASSAPDARNRGYIKATDHWVMNSDEVLNAAVASIRAMRILNYLPPLPTLFPVCGREGHAVINAGLINWLEGGFISQHDYCIANKVAWVLCGGDVNEGELVDEAWILHLEKEAFVSLAEMPETQARIQHLLKTGKPLRN